MIGKNATAEVEDERGATSSAAAQLGALAARSERRT
jgi:hypothetical protein